MADDYWNAFVATVSFMEPCEIVGTLEWRDVFKTNDGNAPWLMLRLDSGRGIHVKAVQARLLEELTRERPQIGDRVRIIYRGEAKRSAPGMSPTKEFTVEVTRKDSQPPRRTPEPGEVRGENAKEAGK